MHPHFNGEPISAERILSFSDVVTNFVEFLIQNFPGKKIRSQLRSSTLYVQLFTRKQLLMRTFMSFDYWMKWVQQQRPLPPIFEKFLATDFTKKPKHHRQSVFLRHLWQTVEAELPGRLSIELTKRTISASATSSSSTLVLEVDGKCSLRRMLAEDLEIE